jgi:hypothetical protein
MDLLEGYMADNISDKKKPIDVKRERFIRIAETRVNKILDDFDSLAKCANTKNYQYTPEDVRKIFGEIDKKLKEIKMVYQASDIKKKRFRI